MKRARRFRGINHDEKLPHERVTDETCIDDGKFPEQNLTMSEIESLEKSDAPKHKVKTRHVVLMLRGRVGRLLLGFSFLAIVFALTAIAQHIFVYRQLYETTSQELGLWAKQVSDEVAYKDKWNLTGYRRASITAPGWFVITKDGLVVDIEGFLPGIFGQAEQPDNSLFDAPKTVTTASGEQWRLFARKVTGGFIVVGICSPADTTSADSKLVANAARFGSTLEQATQLGSRMIDFDVDYAVLSSQGEIKAAWGGIPLKTQINALPKAGSQMVSLASNGKSYLLFIQPILDVRGQEVGTVIVPKEMNLEQKAVIAQDKFNFGIVVFTGLFAVAMALWLVTREFPSRTKTVTLEEALKVGESRTIEFKSTFYWDINQNKYDEERRLDVLKSIAGFLNTNGGALFIGVTENKENKNATEVRGLEEDLKESSGSKDKLQLKLRHLITTRIGPEYSPFIKDDLFEANGKLYWVVTVEESTEPVFVRWKPRGQMKEEHFFYVREGPKTSGLDNQSTWHYIKNKWR